jgi:hypothetical protein
VIVDVRAGFPANIDSLPLSSGRKLREVTTTIDKLPSVAAEVGSDFLRVVVQASTKISGLAQQVCEVLPNALVVKQDVAETIEIMTNVEAIILSPSERFDRCVREQKNTVRF